MKDFNFIVVNVLQYIHVSNYTVHCTHEVCTCSTSCTHEADMTYAFPILIFIYSFFHVYWDKIGINSNRIDKNKNRKKHTLYQLHRTERSMVIMVIKVHFKHQRNKKWKISSSLLRNWSFILMSSINIHWICK